MINSVTIKDDGSVEINEVGASALRTHAAVLNSFVQRCTFARKNNVVLGCITDQDFQSLQAAFKTVVEFARQATNEERNREIEDARARVERASFESPTPKSPRKTARRGAR